MIWSECEPLSNPEGKLRSERPGFFFFFSLARGQGDCNWYPGTIIKKEVTGQKYSNNKLAIL